MYDRFKRRIDYLRISVTDRCNLRCTYCMPPEGIALKQHSDLLSFEQITRIARAAVGLGIEKIRLTGGEPLVRRGIVELVGQLGKIEGLKTLAMTTNGLLLPRYAGELKAAGLQRLNISLDTLDPERYRETTRGGRLEDVISGVDAAIAAGFTGTKINVVVPEARDEGEQAEVDRNLAALQEFCVGRGLTLQKIGLFHLDRCKVDYEAFDRPPKCHECNRLRLTADGNIRPCLHSDLAFPVDFGDIEKAIVAAVSAKPASGTGCTDLNMVSIGG